MPKRRPFAISLAAESLFGIDTALQEVHPQISQISQIGTTALHLRNLRNLRIDMVPFRMASEWRVA